MMVAVSIIGILAAVAVPNFRKYQARAKTGEAMLQLSALYAGETTVRAEYGTYAACAQEIGLVQPLMGYYVVGFSNFQNNGKAMVKTNCPDPGAVLAAANAVQASADKALYDSNTGNATDGNPAHANLNAAIAALNYANNTPYTTYYPNTDFSNSCGVYNDQPCDNSHTDVTYPSKYTDIANAQAAINAALVWDATQNASVALVAAAAAADLAANTPTAANIAAAEVAASAATLASAQAAFASFDIAQPNAIATAASTLSAEVSAPTAAATAANTVLTSATQAQTSLSAVLSIPACSGMTLTNAVACASSNGHSADATRITNLIGTPGYTATTLLADATSNAISNKATSQTDYNNKAAAASAATSASTLAAAAQAAIAVAQADPSNTANAATAAAAVQAAAVQDAAAATAATTAGLTRTIDPSLDTRAAVQNAADAQTTLTAAQTALAGNTSDPVLIANVAAATANATAAAATAASKVTAYMNSYSGTAANAQLTNAINIANAAGALTSSLTNPSSASAITAAQNAAKAAGTTATTNGSNNAVTIASAASQLSAAAAAAAQTAALISTNNSSALQGSTANNNSGSGGILQDTATLNNLQANLTAAVAGIATATPGVGPLPTGPIAVSYPPTTYKLIDSYCLPQTLNVLGTVNMDDVVKNAFNDYSLLVNSGNAAISPGFTGVAVGSIATTSSSVSIFTIDDGKTIYNMQLGY